MGNLLVKVSYIIILNNFCKLMSRNVFQFIIYNCLFYADSKSIIQPHVDRSPNTEFIRENNLKLISHPVKILGAIFPV